MNGPGHEHHTMSTAAAQPQGAPATPHGGKEHPDGPGGGHRDHGAMIADFRRRFRVSIALTSDVGIAIGAGTDVAIESADIVVARATYRKMGAVFMSLSTVIVAINAQLLARLRSKLRSI